MARMVGASNEALRLWTAGRLFSMLQLTTKLTTGILLIIGLFVVLLLKVAQHCCGAPARTGKKILCVTRKFGKKIVRSGAEQNCFWQFSRQKSYVT